MPTELNCNDRLLNTTNPQKANAIGNTDMGGIFFGSNIFCDLIIQRPIYVTIKWITVRRVAKTKPALYANLFAQIIRIDVVKLSAMAGTAELTMMNCWTKKKSTKYTIQIYSNILTINLARIENSINYFVQKSWLCFTRCG